VIQLPKGKPTGGVKKDMPMDKKDMPMKGGKKC